MVISAWISYSFSSHIKIIQQFLQHCNIATHRPRQLPTLQHCNAPSPAICPAKRVVIDAPRVIDAARSNTHAAIYNTRAVRNNTHAAIYNTRAARNCTHAAIYNIDAARNNTHAAIYNIDAARNNTHAAFYNIDAARRFISHFFLFYFIPFGSIFKENIIHSLIVTWKKWGRCVAMLQCLGNPFGIVFLRTDEQMNAPTPVPLLYWDIKKGSSG
jgi:hypothetical protein